MEQRDLPLRKQEEDDTEYIYNKTESDKMRNSPPARGPSAQKTEPKMILIKPKKEPEQQDKDTNDLNISFGRGDWNSISKDGTTLQKVRRPKIQGDYLSES